MIHHAASRSLCQARGGYCHHRSAVRILLCFSHGLNISKIRVAAECMDTHTSFLWELNAW